MNAAISPDWDEIFFSAALEPSRWPLALSEMADQCHSARGQLIGIGGARDIPFNLVTNFSDADIQNFIDIGGGSPAINFRIAANDSAVAKGHFDPILYEADYRAIIPTLDNAFYVDWCAEIDIPYGCQTNLVIDRVGLIGLAVLRSHSDGETTAEDRQTFAMAARAARRAVRLQERIEGNQAQLLNGVFEAMSATAFIIDARGQVQAMTQGAEALLADGSIRLQDKRIDAAGVPMALGALVSALVADDGMDHMRLRIGGTGLAPPVFLEGFRLPVRRWSLGRLPRAIILARPPQRDRAGIAGLLSVLYQFTPSEGDIAMRLFDGARRDEIRDARGVTSETLRGQIKAICAKAGAENEAGLMRLLSPIMS